MLNADKFEAVKEVLEAYTTVMEMAGEFFKVPDTEKKNEKEKAEKTDKEKN
jgi:hypothetical protein